MGKYVRAEHVDAYQIEFSDADKESAKKGLAVSSHGSHIKHEDGVFSVLIHLGDDAKQAKEGEWVVTEKSGNKRIETDEDFGSNYFERDEDEDDEDPGEEKEDEQPSEPATPPVEAIVESLPSEKVSETTQGEVSETAVD